MSKIYQIDYEMQSDDNVKEHTARSMVIHIRAAGDKVVIADAVRFWHNRHKAIPEHFRNCCAVVIYEFDPAPLTENGSLYNTGRVRMVYQWKVSTGMDPGVTVGSKLVKDPTIDPFNVDKPARSMVR